jgi:hypothetical protein
MMGSVLNRTTTTSFNEHRLLDVKIESSESGWERSNPVRGNGRKPERQPGRMKITVWQ